MASISNVAILTPALSVSFIRTHFSSAHTLSLSLSLSLPLRPPRQPSLCAPAVPLLWLEFVLLCFRMATMEAVHAHLPPQPHFFLPLFAPVLTHVPFLSLSLLMPSKNWRAMAFVSGAGVPGRVKRGAGAAAAYCQGGEVIQPGIPHLWQVLTHMSQPVSPGLLNLCGWTLLLSVWLDTHKRPGNAAALPVPHE